MAAVTIDYTANTCTSKKSSEKQKKGFGDPVSKQDVELIVKRALGSTVKLVNYHVRIYSKEKVGFMGAHQHLVVKVKQENSGTEELHVFFLKGIPYEIENQASVIKESRAFYKEANFYKFIVPELLRSVPDKSWVAQCYLINDNVMVFDDLNSKNFATKDKLLGIEHIKSAMLSLGKMHAASILAEKRMGKSFLELYPDALEECLIVQKGTFNLWYKSGVQAAIGVAKSVGLDHTRIAETCDHVFAALTASKKWRNVVCHGDPWSNNLMFDTSEPLPNCCMVDFQMIRYVPAMVDIIQVFYLTMRRSYRETNEEELLRFYHEVFCTTLRESDEEISLPSFEETVQEYEDVRIVGVVTAVLYYQLTLIEGHLCADLTKDSDSFTNLVFRDRTDVVLDIMENDSMYKERVMESITELIQRSNKFLK